MSSPVMNPLNAKAVSSDSLDKLICLIAELSQAMGRLSTETRALVFKDLAALKELTTTSHNQQVWKGWQTVSLAGFTGTLALVGTLIPTGWGATSNQEFLASTAKTVARFLEGGVAPANEARHNATLGTLQSNRELVKMCLDQEQGAESGYEATVRKLHEMTSGILHAAR